MPFDGSLANLTVMSKYIIWVRGVQGAFILAFYVLSAPIHLLEL